MARLLVLTDRAPLSHDWKGAYTWKLILALAESQHEVLVLTTTPLEQIPFTHSRLTVAQPGKSWRADQFPKFAQAILQFKPEIVHTFSLQPTKLWPSLTIWPYLNAITKAIPRLKRVSTFFDSEDVREKDPSLSWHQGSLRWTVFTTETGAKARSLFKGPIDVAPFDVEVPSGTGSENEAPYILIPAPISEWASPISDLMILADFLQQHPESEAHIIGGWGDALLSVRRRGWEALAGVSHQVRLLEGLSLPEFILRAQKAQAVWTRTLKPGSWRSSLSLYIAGALGKELHGTGISLVPGSTSNFLSRLYTNT